MEQHPLSTALSSPLPISPSFIYLHHPYHSSGYALPAGFGDEEGIKETVGEDGRIPAKSEDPGVRIGTLTVKVDLAALAGATDQGPKGTSTSAAFGPNLSQKSFYNATLRTAFSGIKRKIGLITARHRESDTGSSSMLQAGKRKSIRGSVDPFPAAVTTFEETFRPLVGKDVYRWDVFLTRLRLMLDAYQHIIAVGLGQKDGERRMELGLILVILESQLLQKCLGPTWHALLRLNEMMDSCPTSLVLCSLCSWDDVRPLGGDAPEPYHLFLTAPSKDQILRAMSTCNLHPLFPYFLDLLYTACCHLIPVDLISESERLAKTLWQIYMLPLDGFRHLEEGQILKWNGEPMDGMPKIAETDIPLNSLQITYPLLTDLKNRSAYAFASANESLIPNRISASRFLDVFTGERKRKRKEAEEELERGANAGDEMAWFALASQVRQEQQQRNGAMQDPIVARLAAMPITKPPIPRPTFPRLPLYAKYLILAAYCASYNSPRTDLRMFGRGPLTLRGKTRRSGIDAAGSAGRGYEGSGSAGKKTGAGLKKVKTLGKVGKVPQGLLGPKSFPLERMLAIFQSLLAEHGFREDSYDSEDLSDSDSESEHSDGKDSAAMDVDGADDVLNSPSRRRKSDRVIGGKGSAKNTLDFSMVDDETRRMDRKRRKDNARLRCWEEEVEEIARSVGLFALIRELESLRLLNRMSPRDRLDNILIRCEAPKDMVFEYARQIKVDLTSYLVEGE
ncbi:hypothetical protein NliqN6_6398 [Naganishia liquefaciens]|uniref:Origin recognition complex subunit 5 C-terminal domain-containing protein n=1 Tax=Naganishia liquefaciens TaxID=104408 RepID=A0A8H3YJY2_9TREE|nr:hypothetical protein NliqN6_6398 [Naganishia liquefaciens]